MARHQCKHLLAIVMEWLGPFDIDERMAQGKRNTQRHELKMSRPSTVRRALERITSSTAARIPTRACSCSLFLHSANHASVVTALPIVGIRALKRECMPHHFTRVVLAVAVVGLCTIPAVSATAQTPRPDNTKVNARDRTTGAATADQQKENAADRELTRSIRHALMQDKELSTYAHNVKIITQAGQVTLKGPVRSEEEKRVVVAKATEVAGAGHVANQMSVAKKKS